MSIRQGIRSNSTSSISTAERTAGPTDHSLHTPIPVRKPELLDDSREEEAIAMVTTDDGAWIRVANMDASTTNKALLDLFFPYGANEAFIMRDGATQRKIGFVVFSSPEMASLAVLKMNDFIPWRQSQALSVESITPESVRNARSSKSSPTMENSPQKDSAFLRLLEMSSVPQHVAHFIQQQNRMRVLVDRFGEQTTLIIANISRRRTNQA